MTDATNPVGVEKIERLGFELFRLDNGEASFAEILPKALERAGLCLTHPRDGFGEAREAASDWARAEKRGREICAEKGLNPDEQIIVDGEDIGARWLTEYARQHLQGKAASDGERRGG